MPLQSIDCEVLQGVGGVGGRRGGARGAGSRGLTHLYIALAQALVCEGVNIDGGGGVEGWKSLWDRGQEDVVVEGGGQGVLNRFSDVVRERLVRTARQLGAGKECPIDVRFACIVAWFSWWE